MRTLSRYLALAAIAPFLLAFSTPEEPGTTVSASAGAGRYLTASGCAHPRLVEISDQQVGVYHQRVFEKKDNIRYGLGLDVDIMESREKECTEEDCRNPGWEDNPVFVSSSPYATLDWNWFGLRLGTRVPLRVRENDVHDDTDPAFWLRMPLRGALRLGYPRFYLSFEFLDGRSGCGCPAASAARPTNTRE